MVQNMPYSNAQTQNQGNLSQHKHSAPFIHNSQSDQVLLLEQQFGSGNAHSNSKYQRNKKNFNTIHNNNMNQTTVDNGTKSQPQFMVQNAMTSSKDAVN